MTRDHWIGQISTSQFPDNSGREGSSLPCEYRSQQPFFPEGEVSLMPVRGPSNNHVIEEFDPDQFRGTGYPAGKITVGPAG